MLARTKAGHSVALDEAQLQVGAPTRVLFDFLWLFRLQHPAAPANPWRYGRL
jgi:hypothetical protein